MPYSPPAFTGVEYFGDVFLVSYVKRNGMRQKSITFFFSQLKFPAISDDDYCLVENVGRIYLITKLLE